MSFGPQKWSGLDMSVPELTVLELIYEEVDNSQCESRDPTIRGKKWFLFAPS
jgi:hypothetical protein